MKYWKSTNNNSEKISIKPKYFNAVRFITGVQKYCCTENVSALTNAIFRVVHCYCIPGQNSVADECN